VKQEVVHLGEHATADEALTAWAEDVRQLQATRPRKADKLRAKMDRLKELTCQQLRQFINPISDPNADPNPERLNPTAAHLRDPTMCRYCKENPA